MLTNEGIITNMEVKTNTGSISLSKTSSEKTSTQMIFSECSSEELVVGV